MKLISTCQAKLTVIVHATCMKGCCIPKKLQFGMEQVHSVVYNLIFLMMIMGLKQQLHVNHTCMFHTFVVNELQHLPVNINWFQRDGMTAHATGASMNVLHTMFIRHLISWYGNIAWPSQSPDLGVRDFFLW